MYRTTTEQALQCLKNIEQSLERACPDSASFRHYDAEITIIRNALTKKSPDANVEKNREMLLQRSEAGLKKYGVTTERNDLTLADWLQHALEETLDLANYLQAAKARAADSDPVDQHKGRTRVLLERAALHLTDWLDAQNCECEGPGHYCGRNAVRNTRDNINKLLNTDAAEND